MRFTVSRRSNRDPHLRHDITACPTCGVCAGLVSLELSVSAMYSTKHIFSWEGEAEAETETLGVL